MNLPMQQQRDRALVRRIICIRVDKGVQCRNRRHRLQRQKEDRAKRRHAQSSFPKEVAQWSPPRHTRECKIDHRLIATIFLGHLLGRVISGRTAS
jgi:hypothetical protein